MNLSRIATYGLAVFILLSPFYLWESGRLQPAHIVLYGAAILVAMRNPSIHFTSRLQKQCFYFLVAFFCYTLFVNVIQAIRFEDVRPLKFSLYYASAILTWALLSRAMANNRYTNLKILAYACVLTLFGQVVIYALGLGGQGGRATLFFNDPNQMGYFSILCIGIVLIIRHMTGATNVLLLVPALFAAVLLCLITLSRSATGSVLILVVGWVLLNFRLQKGVVAIGLLTIALFVLSLSTGILDSAVEPLRIADSDRLGSVSTTYLSRGTKTLFEYPEFLVFGAGEGLPEVYGRKVEIHSTVLSLFLSYGIVGLTFIILVVAVCFYVAPFKCSFILIPILLYGMAMMLSLLSNNVRHMRWRLLRLVVVVTVSMYSVVSVGKVNGIIPVDAESQFSTVLERGSRTLWTGQKIPIISNGEWYFSSFAFAGPANLEFETSLTTRAVSIVIGVEDGFRSNSLLRVAFERKIKKVGREFEVLDSKLLDKSTVETLSWNIKKEGQYRISVALEPNGKSSEPLKWFVSDIELSDEFDYRTTPEKNKVSDVPSGTLGFLNTRAWTMSRQSVTSWRPEHQSLFRCCVVLQIRLRSRYRGTTAMVCFL